MIDLTEPQKLDLKSMNITEDQKSKLKQIFPHIFNEDKIDVDKLRQTLGEEVDEGQERYGMTWPGKSECFKIIQQPSVGTLKPCREESVNFNETENLFIEGDNLEVLKLLQKSYYNKIKMIYIDPPYNTGKEFIYPDKYTESLDTYLAYTGQVNDEGTKFSTNTETDGRFHSKWLNMMYPRLFLARNLLTDDGVIFISIDDHEGANLTEICNEIFGEENFIEKIVWKKRSTPPNDKVIGAAHEYILIYCKDISKIKLNLKPRTKEQLERYKNPDNHPRGAWTSGDLMANIKGGRYVESLYFPIVNPNTGEKHYPSSHGNWRFNKKEIDKLLANNEIYFGEDGKGRPKLKRFLIDVKDGITYSTLWDFVPLNTQGSKEMTELLGNLAIFDNPKPSGLIKELLRLGSDKDSIILDFFAGSGTTAHSILQLNYENKECRKYIMVQLPEPCDEKSGSFKAGYKTIADIGKERIRRVIKKIEDEGKQSSSQTTLFDTDSKDNIKKLDMGFKVFKLDKSNFNLWDGSIEVDTTGEKIIKQLQLAIENVNPKSSEEDILYELLLKSGFSLTTKIEEIELAGKKVYSIENDALLICLSRELSKEVITEMARREPARVICLDDGFVGNDQLKTNAVQIMKSFGVEDFRTV